MTEMKTNENTKKVTETAIKSPREKPEVMKLIN